MSPAERAPILREGENCWRNVEAKRAAVLVDAADYYRALAEAIERAERSILMLGWDFHSRVELMRDGSGPERDGLTARLEAAVRSRPDLHVHILEWDFAVIYALEREVMPLLRFGFQTHRRVHFRMDDAHPLGASHHQKIVVVDDAVAFSGGIDVTACRWDTSEHAADEARRTDPGFGAYGPFHDVQMAVDGEAARALGELARERWRRATGRRLRAAAGDNDPWPPGLEPDLRNVQVAIARTEPQQEGRAEVREVERLYVDSIDAAEHWIYIENQYFTSARIGDALAESLTRPRGPEIAVVLTSSCSGWLEENTMGVLRANLLERLREADVHGRFAAYRPTLAGVDDESFTLHSKIFLCDDRLLRVGSANLANRSMGLDTECDLAIEASDDEAAEAVRGLRDRLLGEHLDVAPEAVREAFENQGSLLRAVESLQCEGRSLVALETDVGEWAAQVLPAVAAFDLESPVRFEDLVGSFLPEGDDASTEGGSQGRVWSIVVAIVLLAALAAAWRFTALGELTSPERISELAAPLRRGVTGPLLASGLFVLASLAMVPVTALIVSSALVFGWTTGSLVACGGAFASALAGYAIGRILWRDAVRRLAGKSLNRLSRRLARRGALAVAAVRLIPIAPFTVVNLTAGASHIRLRDFAAGTALGMGPGVVVLALAADRAAAAISSPGLATIAIAVGLIASLLVGGAWLRERADVASSGEPGSTR